MHGKCKNVEDLSGNWAPSSTYGQDIVKMANQIINTKVRTNDCTDEYKNLYEQTKKKLDVVISSLNNLIIENK